MTDLKRFIGFYHVMPVQESDINVSGRGSFGIPKNFSSQRKQSRQLRLIEFSKLMNSAIGEKNSRLEESKFEGLQLVSSNKQNISKIKANLNTDVLYGDLSKCIQKNKNIDRKLRDRNIELVVENNQIYFKGNEQSLKQFRFEDLNVRCVFEQVKTRMLPLSQDDIQMILSFPNLLNLEELKSLDCQIIFLSNEQKVNLSKTLEDDKACLNDIYKYLCSVYRKFKDTSRVSKKLEPKHPTQVVPSSRRDSSLSDVAIGDLAKNNENDDIDEGIKEMLLSTHINQIRSSDFKDMFEFDSLDKKIKERKMFKSQNVLTSPKSPCWSEEIVKLFKEKIRILKAF
mmetsp:Transcript_28939/g.33037  ORF Transcript_28939/g.33037 Transcript_28939/m.33037 type:complete len:341 (+) Transcript_28939:500-1522(+)